MSSNVLDYDSSDPKVKIERKTSHRIKIEKASHEIKIESVGKSEKVHNSFVLLGLTGQ